MKALQLMIDKYKIKAIFLFIDILLTTGSTQSTTKTADQKVPKSLSRAYDGMFKIGVALNRRQIGEENSQTTPPLITKHFNTITPENLMKWSLIHPEPDEYAFDAADRFVAFGEKHDIF